MRLRSSLVVFGRAPERGQVKSRLARTLGEDAALALYSAFLGDTCELAAGAADRRVLAAAGAIDHPELARLASEHQMELVPQAEGDLGARMAQAIERELAHAERVCVVGSDAPTLPADYLSQAFARLSEHEVAIGPSTDGGYWLVGARAPEPALFSGMAWSTPEVLRETLRRLRGRRVALLPFHYDVDDADDLALVRVHLGHLPDSVAPRTRRALAALGLSV